VTTTLLAIIAAELVLVIHWLKVKAKQRTGPGILRWYWRELEDLVNRIRPGTL
jgi:hypothetical protein